jgi:hypothetical protein
MTRSCWRFGLERDLGPERDVALDFSRGGSTRVEHLGRPPVFRAAHASFEGLPCLARRQRLQQLAVSQEHPAADLLLQPSDGRGACIHPGSITCGAYVTTVARLYRQVDRVLVGNAVSLSRPEVPVFDLSAAALEALAHAQLRGARSQSRSQSTPQRSQFAHSLPAVAGVPSLGSPEYGEGDGPPNQPGADPPRRPPALPMHSGVVGSVFRQACQAGAPLFAGALLQHPISSRDVVVVAGTQDGDLAL